MSTTTEARRRDTYAELLWRESQSASAMCARYIDAGEHAEALRWARAFVALRDMWRAER